MQSLTSKWLTGYLLLPKRKFSISDVAGRQKCVVKYLTTQRFESLFEGILVS
jgi:hypothetical protein